MFGDFKLSKVPNLKRNKGQDNRLTASSAVASQRHKIDGSPGLALGLAPGSLVELPVSTISYHTSALRRILKDTLETRTGLHLPFVLPLRPALTFSRVILSNNTTVS